MIAFDADVLTEIFTGSPALSPRAANIPPHEQGVPIIVIEEILRGRLNSIRQAESGRSKISVPRAYELLDKSLYAFGQVLILPYSPAADEIYQQWRSEDPRRHA